MAFYSIEVFGTFWTVNVYMQVAWMNVFDYCGDLKIVRWAVNVNMQVAWMNVFDYCGDLKIVRYRTGSQCSDLRSGTG